MSKRIDEIHEKGFDISATRSIPIQDNVIPELDYAKIKVGIKSLQDAVISLGDYRRLNPNMTKEKIQ